MDFTLTQLRAFLAVNKFSGFTAAADETGATQAALSYAVAGLEKSLNDKLLIRQPRLELTELGKIIIHKAQAIVEAADELERISKEFSANKQGSIRLAASTTVCAGLIPGLLNLWKQAFPEIFVTVLEAEDDEMPKWLSEGIVDAAILINPSSADSKAFVLAEDEYKAVIRRDHPLSEMKKITVDDLMIDPILISDTGCKTKVLSICREADPDFKPVQEIRELKTVLELVEAGIGVSIIPGLAEALVNEKLLLVSLEPTHVRTLVLTGPDNRRWAPAVGVLIEHLRVRN
ncbi:DNA-binding transcriptional LysR family regulator [Aurantimicrobium minutum]|uniref:LysR family transcriptional regulator n=1 Tax=Aurantimicrobium minutum TaxID=708131 RepID=UPI00240500C5|nr:LysR family transcriptional regulator [Aurantimicrobium minutum]MDF9809178.1 DNA-binding transcriptional LysR family regulator [Aurantimicrobium minutum]